MWTVILGIIFIVLTTDFKSKKNKKQNTYVSTNVSTNSDFCDSDFFKKEQHFSRQRVIAGRIGNFSKIYLTDEEIEKLNSHFELYDISMYYKMVGDVVIESDYWTGNSLEIDKHGHY